MRRMIMIVIGSLLLLVCCCRDSGEPPNRGASSSNKPAGRSAATDPRPGKLEERRESQKDVWGETVGGIRCGIRVNVGSGLPPLEYVIENVSYDVLVFQRDGAWRFSIKDAAGNSRFVTPGNMLGSREEVYLRTGDRVRGTIRNLQEVMVDAAPGSYGICVTWLGGAQEVASGWAMVEVDGGKPKPVGGKEVTSKRAESVVGLRRPELEIDQIRGLRPPDNERIWGEEHEGLKVGIVTNTAYQAGGTVLVNLWVENNSDVDIKWKYFDYWDFVKLEAASEGGDSLVRTPLGEKLLGEHGLGKRGSFRSGKVTSGSACGWVIDLKKLFVFDKVGEYTIKVRVALQYFDAKVETQTREATGVARILIGS
jgi:hypothetical protein